MELNTTYSDKTRRFEYQLHKVKLDCIIYLTIHNLEIWINYDI